MIVNGQNYTDSGMTIAQKFKIGFSASTSFNDDNNPYKFFSDRAEIKGGILCWVQERIGRVSDKSEWITLSLDHRTERDFIKSLY